MLPIFMYYTYKATRQIKEANGLIYSSLKKENWSTYWTLTVWDNEESMKNYRNKGNHQKAMKKSRYIGDEFEKINWEGNRIPDWQECMNLLHEKYNRRIASS
jgi:heme-degrading monooxygenase HmoA